MPSRTTKQIQAETDKAHQNACERVLRLKCIFPMLYSTMRRKRKTKHWKGNVSFTYVKIPFVVRLPTSIDILLCFLLASLGIATVTHATMRRRSRLPRICSVCPLRTIRPLSSPRHTPLLELRRTEETWRGKNSSHVIEETKRRRDQPTSHDDESRKRRRTRTTTATKMLMRTS